MVGAILSGMFAAGLVARGVRPLDLGAMHGASSAAELGDVVFGQAQMALTVAMHWSFGGCAAVMALAFVVCWGLRDIPLRA
jgi:hypothetical protein